MAASIPWTDTPSIPRPSATSAANCSVPSASWPSPTALWAADARAAASPASRPTARSATSASARTRAWRRRRRRRRCRARYTQGTLPNGLAFAADGSILISNFGTDRLEIMDRDGRTRTLIDNIDGQPIGKVNFVLRDTRDRVWLTVSTRVNPWTRALADRVRDGYVAVLEDGRIRVVADGFHFTNEIRLDAREQWLYIVETTGPRITRMRLDESRPGEVRLVDREIFGPAHLGGLPDGIAFDAHGNLWATLIMVDRLIALTPQGDMRLLLDDGDAEASANLMRRFDAGTLRSEDMQRARGAIAPWMASITFGGPDLRTVYLGSLFGTRIPASARPFPVCRWRTGQGQAAERARTQLAPAQHPPAGVLTDALRAAGAILEQDVVLHVDMRHQVFLEGAQPQVERAPGIAGGARQRDVVRQRQQPFQRHAVIVVLHAHHRDGHGRHRAMAARQQQGTAPALPSACGSPAPGSWCAGARPASVGSPGCRRAPAPPSATAGSARAAAGVHLVVARQDVIDQIGGAGRVPVGHVGRLPRQLHQARLDAAGVQRPLGGGIGQAFLAATAEIQLVFVKHLRGARDAAGQLAQDCSTKLIASLSKVRDGASSKRIPCQQKFEPDQALAIPRVA